MEDETDHIGPLRQTNATHTNYFLKKCQPSTLIMSLFLVARFHQITDKKWSFLRHYWLLFTFSNIFLTGPSNLSQKIFWGVLKIVQTLLMKYKSSHFVVQSMLCELRVKKHWNRKNYVGSGLELFGVLFFGRHFSFKSGRQLQW